MIFFWIAVIAVTSLDQWTKHIIATTFMPGESRIFIPHLLNWTFVRNHSGAFGLFGTHTWFLVTMALGVLGLFWYSFRDLTSHSQPVRIAFGGIVGGAIGNIIDRFHYAYVVDFIDLHWWPVFNVADSCITVSVIVLVLTMIRRDHAIAHPE